MMNRPAALAVAIRRKCAREDCMTLLTVGRQRHPHNPLIHECALQDRPVDNLSLARLTRTYVLSWRRLRQEPRAASLPQDHSARSADRKDGPTNVRSAAAQSHRGASRELRRGKRSPSARSETEGLDVLVDEDGVAVGVDDREVSRP